MFRWHEHNQGNYRYGRFRDYDRTEVTDDTIRMEYNGGSGAFEGHRSSWALTLHFEGGETAIDDEGNLIWTAGTLTAIRYWDPYGGEMFSFTDLNVSLPAVMTMISRGVADIYDWLADGGQTFIGSMDASGPDTQWDGDSITTGAGDDIVRARAGGDTITDMGGADIYRGGAGDDLLSYAQWFWNPADTTQGIVARLGRHSVIGPDGLEDRVFSIERVEGSYLDDRIIGNGRDNRLSGMQGNDVLIGGRGEDIADYHREDDWGGHSGIRAFLGAGRVRDGFGNVDRLFGIEGVDGTDHEDVFFDSDGDNYLRGRGGDDVFYLSGGDDYIRGEGGADRFVFRGDDIGRNQIRDFEVGVDQLVIENATDFQDLRLEDQGGDTYIWFNDGYIRLVGIDADDISPSALGL